MVKRIEDLEIDQDLAFERSDHRAQRVGQVFMAIIVAGALLGAFGAGPISLTEVRDSSGRLSVTYERFGRRGATTSVTLEVAGGVAQNGEVDIWVSSDYLDKMRVEGITPAPDQVASADDGAVYSFLVDEPGDPLTVNFDLTIESMGRESGRWGLKNGDIVELTQYFAP